MSRHAQFLGWAIIAIALTAPAGLLAQAPAPRPGPRVRQFMAGLNLTDAQREQIRTLREQNRAAVREQLQPLRDARRALRSETFADAPDQAKVDALQQQVAALAQQLEARRLDLRQQIAQILTPEQRQYMREHRGERGNVRGRMLRRGRGM